MTQKDIKQISQISCERLERYFKITKKAFETVKSSENRIPGLAKQRLDFIDMIGRYISDAEHFYSKQDFVNAFAALNYAHGWLDAGARLGIFDVHDPELFTAD